MDNKSIISFDPSTTEIQILKKTIANNLNTDEFSLFLQFCKYASLNPFLKQIYAVKRGDAITFQVGIDTYRSRASETGQYQGQLGPFWCGEDGKWLDVWLSKTPPSAAKVGVIREGFREPLWAIAKYSEYVQTTKDGSVNSMWKKMPANQLAKCAEALGLRKGFPEKLHGMYANEEMMQADSDHEQNITPAVNENPVSDPRYYNGPKQAKPVPINVDPTADQSEFETTPAPVNQAASKLSDGARGQMLDMMREMDWPEKRQTLVFQKAEMVSGEKVALDAIAGEYQKFLAARAHEEGEL